jgi:iron complex outermembrane receptor protein
MTPESVLGVQGTGNGDNIIITSQEISEMQALKISEVLNDVPGLKAGDSSVSIHGSYKVKVFLDGRPINDPTSSHSAVNWDLVAPEDVKRIEIMRGKGGLTYGQDASGGVILISTKDKQQISGNIKAYAGNFDTRDFSVSINSMLSERLGLGLSGGYESTDGYKVNNDQERYQGGFDLSYKLDKQKKIDFSLDHLRDERGLSGYPDFPTPHSRKVTQNTAYALQADFYGYKSKTHFNQGYRHNTDKSRDLDKTLRVSKFGEDLTTTFKTTDRGNLSCGLSFNWDQASGSSFADQSEHSYSLFASQPITWPRYNLTLTTGLRANYHSAFENTLNPEIELAFKKKKWRISASYSRSDNAPSFYQRYNETSTTKPNPDLVLEKADNFSLNLFTELNDSFSLNISGFYNLLTNRITYVRSDQGTGQYQNFGEVYYTGGDLAFNWKINSMLKTKASYTYLEVKDKNTGLWVPCKARHHATMDLYWQPWSEFSIVFSEEYTSSVYINKGNTEEISGFFLTDLRAEYSFQHISLFCEIKNALDKKYYYVDGLLAPPRTWVAGINYKF